MRPTLYVPFVEADILSTFIARVSGILSDKIVSAVGLTGSGMRLLLMSSTWTVVGNWVVWSHSPSFVPWPPPSWVKDQS